MACFIQASDWQIGMKGGGLGEAGPVVRETRIESTRNVLKAARDKKANFVLLCGDIFEHNMVGQEEVRKVVGIFNEFSDVPIYILPGNHDLLGAGCLYNREIFRRVGHLRILRTCDPVEIGEVTLHPCPPFLKRTRQDLTARIPVVRDLEGIHIGVAHGSLIGKSPVPNWEDTDLPIDPSCVDRTGIDYLALGHWHSYRTFPDRQGMMRIAYSGTHEQTSFDEDCAGQCLLVQIDKKGDAPRIEQIRTGQLAWVSRDFEMSDSPSLLELREYLESIRSVNMVRLVLLGELSLEPKAELDDMLEFQTTLHKHFRVKSESLHITVPLQLDAPFDYGDPILGQTEARLRQLLAKATDPKESKTILEAIARLRRLAKEADA